MGEVEPRRVVRARRGTTRMVLRVRSVVQIVRLAVEVRIISVHRVVEAST